MLVAGGQHARRSFHLPKLDCGQAETRGMGTYCLVPLRRLAVPLSSEQWRLLSSYSIQYRGERLPLRLHSDLAVLARKGSLKRGQKDGPAAAAVYQREAKVIRMRNGNNLSSFDSSNSSKTILSTARHGAADDICTIPPPSRHVRQGHDSAT